MNIINYCLLASALLTTATHPKMVEFAENTYGMQAPAEIIALADKTAERIGFESGYEVAIPKKAGLVGWQRFAVGYTNGQTQNAFILVNPEWFKRMPEEQQMFLIARGMLYHTYSLTPPYASYINILVVLISVGLLILLFWLLGKTPLNAHSSAIRWFVACALTIALQKIALEPAAQKVLTYSALRHDIYVANMAAEKLGDKESAIKALEFYDASIKEAVKNGEALFKPFENSFSNIIEGLKQ